MIILSIWVFYIMVKLRRMGDGLGDAVLTLLWPLASPGLEKKFSIENFYAAYGYITNEEDEPGLKIDNEYKLLASLPYRYHIGDLRQPLIKNHALYAILLWIRSKS